MTSLCIFCGSRQGSSPAYAQAAIETGRFLADRGIRLVYGGGSVGLMGIVADACLEAGGEVTGVITQRLMDREVGHTGVDLEIVESMLDRKSRMAELSDGFISLPGGIGTLDELFEMVTWTQLHIHEKRNGLLNIDGYFDSLIDFLQFKIMAEGFVSESLTEYLCWSDSIEELVELVGA
jgi:uncharacterized protein (TIGR00730 family)